MPTSRDEYLRCLSQPQVELRRVLRGTVERAMDQALTRKQHSFEVTLDTADFGAIQYIATEYRNLHWRVGLSEDGQTLTFS